MNFEGETRRLRYWGCQAEEELKYVRAATASTRRRSRVGGKDREVGERMATNL